MVLVAYNERKKRQVWGVGAVDQGGFTACQAPFVFWGGKEGSGAAVAILCTWVLQKDAQMFNTQRTHTSYRHPTQPQHLCTHT